MPSESFEETVTTQLRELRQEIADLRDLVHGRPSVGWTGVLSRIENNEKRIADMSKIQDSFIRDREAEREAAEKREKFRGRVFVAVLATFGAILSGIVIQLFVLISSAGSIG